MDEEDFIPMENLEDSGLKVFPYEVNPGEQRIPPDNVLIAGLGSFERVTVVGQQEETGDLYFASSSYNTEQIIEDLSQFIYLLKTGRYSEE